MVAAVSDVPSIHAQVFLGGLYFGEGPRWHDGRLKNPASSHNIAFRYDETRPDRAADVAEARWHAMYPGLSELLKRNT